MTAAGHSAQHVAAFEDLLNRLPDDTVTSGRVSTSRSSGQVALNIHAPLQDSSTDSPTLLLKRPDDELFHCMVSYRVNTDAARARAIHDGLHFKALNAKKKLDFFAIARYPSGFNRARETKQSWLHIFLDKFCLQSGKDWADEGFLSALLSSLTFIPLLSWQTEPNGEHKGSVGGLAQHNKDSPVDNVLLELVLAKELHSSFAKASNRSEALYPCMHIIPIFVQDLFAMLPGLSDDAPLATLEKAALVLGSVGIHPDASFSKQSVKGIISYFTKLQGVKYFELGTADSANEQVVARIWDHFKTQAVSFDIDRFQLDSFSENNPHGQELLHFLLEADAGFLARFLVKHAVSSVAMLADMRHHSDAIRNLGLEISKACKRPVLEETIKLVRIVNAAAESHLARPLHQRLHDFVDTDASILTAIYSSSALDIMLSKEKFRYIVLLIGVVSLIIAIKALFGTCAITDCNTLALFWIFLGTFATVIVSKFSSPRRGRFTVSFILGLGCAVLHAIVFVYRYHNCNWNFIVCNDLTSKIRSSIPDDAAQNLVALDYIYRFSALLLLYLVGTYTLAFKQHLAWVLICLLAAHYNLFVVIMTLYLYTYFPGENLFVMLGFILFLSATELLNRAGRTKAQALVLRDSDSRQAHWSNLMANNQGFKERIALLQSTINGGSLAPVCEPLDPKTSKMVPRIVVQAHADIDKLYRDCSVLNFFFQDWVRTWFPSGKSSDDFEFCNPKAHYRDAFKVRVANCFPDIVRGPIKAPNRVISKVYRSYRGQVDRVTDLIRCAIVFSRVDELVRFIEEIDKRNSSVPNTKPFEVVRVRNRFNPIFDSRHSAGYRDLALKVKVGFERSPLDNCWLLPVQEWTKPQCRVVVCEIQVHLKDLHCEVGSEAHKNYVEMRNLLAQ